MKISSGIRRVAGLSRPASPEILVRLFVLLVCTSVLGITAWRLHIARDLALSGSRIDTANLSRALADHAHDTVQMADVLITGLVERIEADGASEATLARLHRHMVARVGEVRQVHDLILYAADGSWIASSLPVGSTGGNNGDREYFTYHSTHADRTAHIGPPVRSQMNGRWTIPVSRRFDRPDGSFGGVVVATIDFDTFAGFYASLDVGTEGLIALVNQDSTMLIRVPAAPDVVGASIADTPAFRAYRQHGPTGDFTAVSRVDGVKRLNSFRQVDAYPLVVFVAQSEDDILAGWRRDAWVALAAAAALALVLGAAGWRLAGQIRLRQQAEAAVRASERQYRLLAEHGTDLVIQLGPDLRRVYASPASKALLGYAPEELIGRHPEEMVHPEDWPAVSANLTAIAREGRVLPISYRARRKDGAYVWAEVTGRRLDDGQGFVIAIRDVARRKEVEELLHQANNQLQRLVMLDGLTGIPNRRCFDRALEKEFRRAARTEMPLALLLLDVDRFKLYNDTYGHPAGDACLQAIAEAVSKHVQRPGDLAARYGGEELAVLLPDTDGVGAMALAERIRLAVRQLGIEHGANPDGIATISIGVAVTWPHPRGTVAMQDLVAQADAALYQAKVGGRDCALLGTPEALPVDLSQVLARSPPQKRRGLTRVLLVDDDPGVRELLGDMLEISGFEVARAGGGKDALTMLRAAGERYDVLVTDYAMPGMTGDKLVKQARQTSPGLPALLITGYADGAALREMPGGLEVLHKPFRVEELASRIFGVIASAAPPGAPTEPGLLQRAA